MSNTLKILYICTHNRCRSILSEAISNNLAGDILDAKSAGSQPAGVVHPLSLKYLEQSGYDISGLQSQSWDDFENFAPDIVVTVCDSAAGEACPLYFSNAIKVHWGLSDPSKISGTEAQVESAFLQCIEEVAKRVHVLKDIASKGLHSSELKAALVAAGAQ